MQNTRSVYAAELANYSQPAKTQSGLGSRSLLEESLMLIRDSAAVVASLAASFHADLTANLTVDLAASVGVSLPKHSAQRIG